MEIVLAFLAGGLIGWLIGWLGRRSGDEEKRAFRPNKRQRKILATLPPDPVLPTLDELVREEAEELGVDRIPGADDVPLGIRLRVWKRDHELRGPCERWQFVIASGVDAHAATADQIRLECRKADEDSTGTGDTS